jgi:signal transduction histidine kinase/CheY-like chemotaxis protein
MWQTLRRSRNSSPDFASSAKELGARTAEKLILTTGITYLILHLVVSVAWPGGIGWKVWVISPIVFLSSLLAWWLVSRSYLLAQVVWLIGLFLSIGLSVVIFQEPRIAYLYALLPLMAVIIIGWQASALLEALILFVLAWFLPTYTLMMLPLEEVVIIALVGAFCALLGWAASDAMLMVAYWSLSSYEQAREMTEEAQRNRGQLARVLHDLDQAYYRLQRANAALVVAWRTAAEAERFRAEFATNISHELRTPLNLIVGFSEMMMTSPETYGQVALPGLYRRDLNSIYNSAQHLLGLVDDVIDLARIDAGKITIAREEVDLSALVREAANMVHDYVAAKGLALHIHVSEDLPVLYLDRLRIRQVLLNLLVNAARFTEKGSITLHVSRMDGEALMRVTDTGQGIPAQELPRIFDEFRPQKDGGESPWAWHSGSGLGLPISKRFIELHGGRMGVESVYMQGTTIWFSLPLGHAGMNVPGKNPQALPAGAGVVMPALSSVRPPPRLGAGVNADERIVVVINEDHAVPAFLQRYLSGYRVVGACDVPEGVALAADLKPVAVLIDASIERGAEIESSLSALNSVPVVRCPLPSSLRVAQALGAREMLSKPTSREDLLAALDRLERPVQRVLIADDDPDMVRLFQRMLTTRLPAEACLEAYSGAEAMERLHREKPDLLLLDLIMPEVNGYTVLKHMAANPELAHIPVFVISAQVQDNLADQLSGPIDVRYPHGMRISELTGMLDAILNALAAGWR